MRKRKTIKKANRGDEWLGRLDERTNNIIDAVREVKDHSVKFEEKVEMRFTDLHTNLEKCINDKFDGHNDYHIVLERKYTKLFIVLAALTIGCLLSNPAGVVYLASKILSLLKIFIGLL